MHPIRYTALPTDQVRALRAGDPDAYGNPPERAISDGDGNPCRHCLNDIAKGAEMLILAHRPFPAPQPYAETGPIFLCGEPCSQWEGPGLPPVLTTCPAYLLRGYCADDRIVYGTGAVVAMAEIPARAAALFADPAVRYVHVRSASNNCYQCRIDRGGVA